MSIFSLFKRKQEPALFSGGNGESFETAVTVHADNSVVGVQLEYVYVATQCGQPHRDWTIERQSLQEHDGKPHDVLSVRLSNGQTRDFYFDVSAFFGK